MINNILKIITKIEKIMTFYDRITTPYMITHTKHSLGFEKRQPNIAKCLTFVQVYCYL